MLVVIIVGVIEVFLPILEVVPPFMDSFYECL